MILDIILLVFLVKRAISLAKQKGLKSAGWAIFVGLSYGIPSIATSFTLGVLIGLGEVDQSFDAFPKSLILALIAMGVGLLCTLIPFLILRSKPDANPDIASPFTKEKDIDESNTDILDA